MPQQKLTIWVIVYVAAGVTADVKVYRTKQAALGCFRQWQEEMDENKDDVQMYSSEV